VVTEDKEVKGTEGTRGEKRGQSEKELGLLDGVVRGRTVLPGQPDKPVPGRRTE